MIFLPHTELLNHTAAKYQTATPLERKAKKLLREKRLGQLANLWQVLVGRTTRVPPCENQRSLNAEMTSVQSL